jgi:enoyl-CoA hydratase/carnithine racemase
MGFATVTRDGAILTVTIDRQERLNALHSPAHFELSAIFDTFERDPGLRVAIVTGAGQKAFCAGNDLKFQAEGGTLERPATGFAGLTKRIGRTKPIIGAINGLAFGGGFETVLSCDLAIAVRFARFCLPEVNRGLVPMVALHLLPRQLPMKIAKSLLLTGAEFGAEEALRWGLINEISEADSLMSVARQWADRIVSASPVAVATSMDIIERGLANPDITAGFNTEYDSFKRLQASDDFIEGPRAFAMKRKPQWR